MAVGWGLRKCMCVRETALSLAVSDSIMSLTPCCGGGRGGSGRCWGTSLAVSGGRCLRTVHSNTSAWASKLEEEQGSLLFALSVGWQPY